MILKNVKLLMYWWVRNRQIYNLRHLGVKLQKLVILFYLVTFQFLILFLMTIKNRLDTKILRKNKPFYKSTLREVLFIIEIPNVTRVRFSRLTSNTNV